MDIAPGRADDEDRSGGAMEGLERFVTAQDPVWPRVVAELEAGAKRSHWMWFVFPQVAGLGSSAMAQRYAIASLDEARAYLAHPVLGPRLREATDLMLGHAGRPAEAILGGIDAMKFRSSMTLFRAAAPDDRRYARALDAFWGGVPDPRTLERLAS
jgi:uncharacterized protein (DUF1810 family)